MRENYDFIDKKEKQDIRNEVKRFLDTHRDVRFSAAKFEYSLYLDWEQNESIIEMANKSCPQTEKDLEFKEMIQNAMAAEDLLNLMRKELSGSNKSFLRRKIMEHEIELLPMIKEKCIRNKQDIFIENALHFFMKSNVNCCGWIMEVYSQFQSEYLKSLFCLILGFRGDVSMIPFLIEEAGRMEKDYPREYYDQGPTLAVQELAARYFN